MDKKVTNGLKSFLNMQFFFNWVKGIASDDETQHISHFYDARNLRKTISTFASSSV